jgi:hypothetical protein
VCVIIILCIHYIFNKQKNPNLLIGEEMKTELIMRLEHEPKGYHQKFAQDCKFEIIHKEGWIKKNYSNGYLGRYSNLRIDGEAIVTDIIWDKDAQPIIDYINYMDEKPDLAIDGSVCGKNDKGECTLIKITGVSVIW